MRPEHFQPVHFQHIRQEPDQFPNAPADLCRRPIPPTPARCRAATTV